jgi:hypothetical protein
MVYSLHESKAYEMLQSVYSQQMRAGEVSSMDRPSFFHEESFPVKKKEG